MDLLPWSEAGADVVAIAAAAAGSLALGVLWYSEPLFGRAWNRLMGLRAEQAQTAFARGLALSAAMAVLMAVGVWWLIHVAGTTGIAQGVTVGLVAGVTIAATASGSDVASAGRSVGLLALNGSLHVVRGALLGLILGAWT